MEPLQNLRAEVAIKTAPWLVLVVGIAISGFAWKSAKSQVEARARTAFEEAVVGVRSSIQSRLTSYIDVLYGLQGLFHASSQVSRSDFNRYVNSLGMAHRYPQIRNVSFSPVVSLASKKEFERRVRADESLDPGGYPDFAIRPPGNREIFVPLTYMEPMQENRVGLGFDLASEAERYQSIMRARDTGRVISGPRLALQSDPAQDFASVLRLSVYRPGANLDTMANRRLAFAGVLALVVRVPDLVEDILANTHSGDIALRVVDVTEPSSTGAAPDATAGSVLFDSAAKHNSRGPMFEKTGWLDFGGRIWDLTFTAPRARFAMEGDYLPSLTLAGGLLLTFLLAGLIYALSNTSRRAGRIADRITRNLRESESRLAAAQRRTQELIEALPVPVYFKTTDGRYAGVNKAWENFFGISRETFLGKTVHELYPHDRDVADRLIESDLELWKKPGTLTHETSIVKPDGTARETVYYKATYADDEGKVAGLIGTIVDVTERKQAEDGLRKSEAALRSVNQQLQMVIGSSPLAIYSRDPEGLLTNWNPAAEKMFGWKAEEVLGKTLPTLSEKSRAQSDAYRRRLLAGEPPFKVEVQRLRRDGSLTDIEAFLGQLRDADGTITGIITIAADVTERKRSEQRLAMEVAVTRVIAESKTLADAIPLVLQKFCESMDWQYGATWELDPATGLLRCAGTWCIDNDRIREFAAASANHSDKPEPRSEGLVRQTYATKNPVWIADVVRADGFRRRDIAARAGLHAAFAFPLLSANEVLGVMEFFSSEVRQPDDTLAHAVQSIGSQMGQYVVRMRAEEALKFVASHDGLTGLPNREMFAQRLSHAIARARRYVRQLTVLFVDLDRFKVINDTLGHDIGDELLRVMAVRMTGNVRETDTVARLGGDEFVVLLEEISDPTVVRNIVRKLLVALGKEALISNRELSITASIGIATYPEDGGDAQTLLKNADIAMYRAKQQGRNTLQFYSAEMNVHTIEQLTLESNLRNAIERNELLLHYQPQVDIRSGRLTGFEALVRWQHPVLGLVPPADFISIAEESGLIVSIGEWVLRTACETRRAWQDAGLPEVRVSVNLSARQLMKVDLFKDVANILTVSRFAPPFLELEITESMVMHNPEHAVTFLEQVKQLGVQVSIDDFGTGYSSLAYLQRLPIDRLKIDRSFIAEIPRDADSMAITNAVIAMAHSLHLSVVAEGVETKEQANFLAAHGCDEMQGYFISRPLPEAEARALLSDATKGVAVLGQ